MNKVNKISDGVFQLENSYNVLDSDLISLIKDDCISNKKKRSRINFHQSPSDYVQEMIIAMHINTDIPVHRHINKCESFHLIEGRVCVVLFKENSSQIFEEIILDSTKRPFYRLNTNIDHLVIPLSLITIIHETTEGPFNTESSIIPEWSLTKSGHDTLKLIKSNVVSKHKE